MNFVHFAFFTDVPLFIVMVIVLSHYLLNDYDYNS